MSSLALTQQSKALHLPAINVKSSRDQEQGQSLEEHKGKALRVKSLIAHSGKAGRKISSPLRPKVKVSSILIDEGAEERKDIEDGVVIVKRAANLVSFGRRIIPYEARIEERKRIMEKRRKFDTLIATGLKASGIELDAHERHLQQLLESTQSASSDSEAATGSYLPNINDSKTKKSSPRHTVTSNKFLSRRDTEDVMVFE